MPDQFFTREKAKEVVKSALRCVADFRGDNIEHFTFSRFTAFHKAVFLAALLKEVRSVVRDNRYYYNIRLDDHSIDNWPMLGDCIDWIHQHKGLRRSNTQRLKRQDLES